MVPPMRAELVNEELIEYRRRLAEFVRSRPAYTVVRKSTDELICLLDEAPTGKRPVINRLIDKYEALLESLRN